LTKETRDKKLKTRLSQSGFERFVMWACAALAMGCVIAGRVETFHMTEGKALVYGWKYWTGTIAFAFGAGLLSKRLT
jgi:hypothetical protein